MPPTPDLTGFMGAQRLLREQLGQDVTFHIPTPKVWPEGTALDRETGEPYDMTVVPISGGGFTDVTKRVSVRNRLVNDNSGAEGAGADRAGGIFRNETVALGLAASDHAAVNGATEMTVGSVRYKLTEIIVDPAFNQNDRYLIFGEAL